MGAPDWDFKELLKRAEAQGRPEEVYDIRIARDGTWFHNGGPIGRAALTRLFASVLYRDEAGDYWLVTPAERGRITVDDAPFTVVEMAVEGSGEDRTIRLRTNLDDWVSVDDEHPLFIKTSPVTGEEVPYVTVRGRLDARLERTVYYELVELAEPLDGGPLYGVWSGGSCFPLGRA